MANILLGAIVINLELGENPTHLIEMRLASNKTDRMMEDQAFEEFVKSITKVKE